MPLAGSRTSKEAQKTAQARDGRCSDLSGRAEKLLRVETMCKIRYITPSMASRRRCGVLCGVLHGFHPR